MVRAHRGAARVDFDGRRFEEPASVLRMQVGFVHDTGMAAGKHPSRPVRTLIVGARIGVASMIRLISSNGWMGVPMEHRLAIIGHPQPGAIGNACSIGHGRLALGCSERDTPPLRAALIGIKAAPNDMIHTARRINLSVSGRMG
jgi:hypothetical protein